MRERFDSSGDVAVMEIPRIDSTALCMLSFTPLTCKVPSYYFYFDSSEIFYIFYGCLIGTFLCKHHSRAKLFWGIPLTRVFNVSCQIFYWTHLLSLPFWVLLVLHGPNFWKWLLVPGVAFLLETSLRVSQVCTPRGQTHIVGGTTLPSQVRALLRIKPLILQLTL